MDEPAAPIVGLVLAAGAGTRFGGPKGLARDAAGTPWVERAVDTLRRGGCGRVLVAVGARGDEVAALVPPGAEVVEAAGWADGLSATLRAGLATAVPSGPVRPAAVVILPVDVPDAPPSAVRRVVAAADADLSTALVQATYDGAPGHPVLIGAEHAPALAESVAGDDGARLYLRTHGVIRVECGDLWSGADIDTR
ncbi:nucleotidyltransferase family protein [Microbacterium aquimaris]|uniref:nucleotidyltransferase family protein n=1 Tax=Microbacterium aquimaris TaxID=459816 RepID=UPI002AD40E62|nr:nucleotidyltransferase family protein [Microbacterium aquimaris]MDZ8276440.1 nucleotidyltransferase family protein [Microbacterium aquimaris]